MSLLLAAFSDKWPCQPLGQLQVPGGGYGMQLSTGLCLVAINSTRRSLQHQMASQGWLDSPRGPPFGTAPALTMGSVLGAAGLWGTVQLLAEGGSVICVDQLVHTLVDEI